jgi:hypothetical protein
MRNTGVTFIACALTASLLSPQTECADRSMLEDRVDLTPEVIRTAVRHGMPIMPPFRKTEVTDAELDAVIAYLTQKKHK